MGKAFLRKELLDEGYNPDYHCEGREIEIDWSQGYESWQPDYFDSGLNEGDGYNMILVIPSFATRFFSLVWVNSLDFDFEV